MKLPLPTLPFLHWLRARTWRLGCGIGVVAAAAGTSIEATGAPQACSARSPAATVPVVELYTSEGCNSCPPADRWLGALKGRTDVVALAFHVDYWDRLGWKDRFASAAFTRRQAEQQVVNGARFSYTPQVVIDGRDRKDWPRAVIASAAAAAPVVIELLRDGDRVRARVTDVGNAPPRLTAYWAVTEFGHRTAVKAGENEGATLAHEFVVRELQPDDAWSPVRGGVHELSFSPRGVPDAAHLRRVNLVVVDAASGRPVQALALDC
jgi:hypothetical protein